MFIYTEFQNGQEQERKKAMQRTFRNILILSMRNLKLWKTKSWKRQQIVTQEKRVYIKICYAKKSFVFNRLLKNNTNVFMR